MSIDNRIGKEYMKRIGITQRVEVIEGWNERRNALSQEWEQLAKECGFLPIFLPNDETLALQLIEELDIDGILLTGGNNLISYGGDAAERDQTERALIAYAIEKGLPLLGICRGMQMILDYFGIPLQKVIDHIRVEHLLDTGKTVNSYHSFGVMESDCKAPIIIKAVAQQDRVVEWIGHNRYPNIHGIMWHPERYHPFREEDMALLKEIFQIEVLYKEKQGNEKRRN